MAPESIKNRVNYGRFLMAEGRLEAAELHFRQAETLAPEHPLVLTNLAVSLERRGLKDAAWEMSQRAAERSRRPGVGVANLCAMALDRDDLSADELLSRCRAAVKAVPDRVEPAVNLARALVKAGQLAEAESLYGEIAARFAQNPYLLGHRVGFYLSSGRMNAALEDQRSLVRMAPDDPQHHRNLVALLAQAASVAQDAGDQVRACALAMEMGTLAPNVAPVQARMKTLCPGKDAL